jgi:crotonobetainyl-CoA:carnitine CoA-transferase CaiB-like acyl-CoA transferase
MLEAGELEMVEPSGVLEGLRVLELGRVLAAPWAAQILGDLGADVVKIERPGVGDEGRSIGHRPARADGGPAPASMFTVSNRNKRSVCVDLAQPDGVEVVRQLAVSSDIVIENFLPDALSKYGLDYASLKDANPGLIYCSVTGYGQTGPYRDRPGYDGVFQALGGLMSVTGIPDGEPGAGPMKCGPSLVDVTTGYLAVIGVLAALHSRERTGLGQHVDANLLDAVVSLQSSLAQAFLISRRQPQRSGTGGNGGHPSRMFSCVDGQVFISAGNNKHYRALIKALGLDQLDNDPRFADNKLRHANRLAWNAIAEPVIRMWRREELLEVLAEAKVPAGPVATYEEVFSDRHSRARGLTFPMSNPSEPSTDLDLLASPIRLSRTPVSYRRRPPNLGEHTDEVLNERLGLTQSEIERLRKLKAI